MSTEDFPEASFEAAMAAANAAMPVAEVVPDVPPVATTAAPVAQPVVPAPSGEPASTGPAPVPQYILDREAALEARERATREAESKAREVEQRENSLKARESAVANAASEFEADPVGFAKKLRPDLTPVQAAKWAEHMYAFALGKEAPAELRLEQKIAEVDRNAKQANERLSKENEELRRQAVAREQAAMVAKYTSELKASASDIKADASPYLAHLAKSDPDQYAKELFEEAVKDCEKQWAADNSKEPVPPAIEELSKRAEARIKAQVEKYAPAPVAQAQKAPPVALTNRVAGMQPPRTEIDPDSDEALRAAALKAIGREDLLGTW